MAHAFSRSVPDDTGTREPGAPRPHATMTMGGQLHPMCTHACAHAARRRYDDVMEPSGGRSHVGISGWDYPRWKGRFYPRALQKKRWLDHALRSFDSIELNGTFYSLKRPASFMAWRDAARATGRDDVTFAIKGGRFITHMKKLRDCERPLANFFASGVLALEETTGPFLWQLPEMVAFDPDRLASFFALLPRSSTAAAQLARKHDARLAGRAFTETPAVDVAYRHALEPRHPSFFTREAIVLLEEWNVGLVIADSAGRFPMARDVTAPFVYVRLHGSTKLYTSGYTDEELAIWASRARAWMHEGRDVYVYFDNDALGHAPFDAQRLNALLRSPFARARGRAAALSPHAPRA
jgi:uncharacterized protein YecE (DUF72 family)